MLFLFFCIVRSRMFWRVAVAVAVAVTVSWALYAGLAALILFLGGSGPVTAIATVAGLAILIAIVIAVRRVRRCVRAGQHSGVSACNEARRMPEHLGTEVWHAPGSDAENVGERDDAEAVVAEAERILREAVSG